MYRVVSFIVIFSFVSVMLYFHMQNGHSITSTHVDTHNHTMIEIPNSSSIPSISGTIRQDESGTWLFFFRKIDQTP